MTLFAGRLPESFTTPGNSSFADFLGVHAPELLPGRRVLPGAVGVVPHATTIVAVTCESGVIMAGDRRATMGMTIAQRDIEKVFQGDEFWRTTCAASTGPGRTPCSSRWRRSWPCSRSMAM